MPLYEYECKKCHHRVEKIQSFSARHMKKCPDCGGVLEQVISAPAVQFKGSGWYVTDYAKKASAGSSSSNGDSASKTESGSKAESGSKPESSDSKDSGSRNDSAAKSESGS
ncbi:MAG TPA: zinc ribbon domain-containing protein, partial [Terriglobales bacterium]|nr:zinc ribbon domain-containing protein [Terriglobales bacterium]